MSIILGLIYEDMAAFEVTLLHYLLARFCDKKIVLIAQEMGSVRSKSAMLFEPNITIEEALDLEGVDGLIIPGGWNDNQSPELTTLIKKLNSQNKLLAGICRGPSYFARAGILEGVKYTTTYSPQLAEDLGVVDPFDRSNYQNSFVVKDSNIITSKGTAFIEFSMEICDYFGMFKTEKERVEMTERYRGNIL